MADPAAGYVLFTPASAQSDSSANASIFINDTGGGNLLQLQSSAVDQFVVSSTGDVALTGSLSDPNSEVYINDAAYVHGNLGFRDGYVLYNDGNIYLDVDENNNGTNYLIARNGADTEVFQIDESGNVQCDGYLTVSGEKVYVGGTSGAVHYSDTGYYGQANGWDPNTGAPDIALWLEFGGAESSGFYADEDVAVIWSPGDADILRVYDEDNLPTGDPKFVINSSGNVIFNRAGTSTGAGVYYDSRIAYFRANNWDSVGLAAQDVAMRLVNDAYGDDDSYRLAVQNNAGTTVALIDPTGNLSVGQASGTDNDSIYFDTGTVEYLRWDDANTQFLFSDDVKSGGDFVTSATDGVINAGGATNALINVIADTATINNVNGDEDLYIQDDLEVDGTIYLGEQLVFTNENSTKLRFRKTTFDPDVTTTLYSDTYVTIRWNAAAVAIDFGPERRLRWVLGLLQLRRQCEYRRGR